MKLVSFSVPYTQDKRMVYAAEYLERHGFIYKQNIDESDFVLLPVPVKKEMLDSLNGKFAFYGKGEYKNGFDYMKDETYVLKNALLTAEGAVACLEENTDYSLIGKNILIIGYGRIAKALRKILSSYGSNITVCSRSSISGFIPLKMIWLPSYSRGRILLNLSLYSRTSFSRLAGSRHTQS